MHAENNEFLPKGDGQKRPASQGDGIPSFKGVRYVNYKETGSLFKASEPLHVFKPSVDK